MARSPLVFLALASLLALSACAQPTEEEDSEGAGSAATADEKPAPLNTKSDWSAAATDLSWLVSTAAKSGYLYPQKDIMADTFRPGGWAAFSKDEGAKIAPGAAAGFKLPARSDFEFDELGVSSVVLTNKPLQFTFCALNAAKKGVCREARKGDGRGAAVSLTFNPADAIAYVIMVRGKVVNGKIEAYAGDVADAESWSASAIWRIGGKPTSFPRIPLTKSGW